MHAYLKASRHHAQWIVNTALLVEDELLWQKMQNFPVSRQGNCAGFVHRLTDFFSTNFARSRTEGNSALTIYSTNMRPGDAKQAMFDRNSCGIFRLFHCALD